MNPDIEGLKSYIGGLVLDLFLARGQIAALTEKLSEKTMATDDPSKVSQSSDYDPLRA